MSDIKKDFAAALVASWTGGAFVARRCTSEFTGGALSGRTVANVESRGDKVPGRIMVGRNIAYPTENFARWLAEKMLKDC